MEPILNKKEIDDLLQAIKKGQVSLDLDKEDTTRFSKEYTPVNLFQMKSLSDELSRLPNFDIILDNFSQNLAITLTNDLQRTFAINRTQIESSHFLDFLLDNKDAGAIVVLDVTPLKHGALILIDAHMCFSMVEILLGASTDIELLQPNRKLTSIELKIIQSVMAKGCEDLNRAFAPLVDLQSSLLKVESNSRLVSITDPDAEIIIGNFEIKIGEQTGEMKIVFPLSTLDPLRDNLRDLLSVNKAKQGVWTRTLEKQAHELVAELVARSGTIKMSINDILGIQKGDILYIDYNPNAPLNVLVEDKPKFYAVPGTHGGKKAISITGINEQGA